MKSLPGIVEKLILGHQDAIIQMPSGATNTPGAANRKDRSAMGSIASPRFYVYILCRPNGKPFYVGKGTGRRVHRHDDEARRGCRCHKCNIIRKIWKSGGDVQRYIVFTTDDEQEALAYEVELIALYGQKNLANVTEGGSGISGRVQSAEERRRRDISRRRVAADPVFREQQRQRMLKRYQDPAERAKTSAAVRKRYENPEVLEKQRAIMRKIQNDPSLHMKRSAATKERMKDPAVRAKFVAFQQKDPVKLSANAKQRWADPEYKARVTASLRLRASDPAYRAALSAGQKRRFEEDPDARQKRSEAAKLGWQRKKQKS